MPSDNELILVRDGDRVREIPREGVYFTFASGRLAYDCVTCKAQCCRGYGYLLTSADELQGQLRASPGIALFLDHGRGRAPGTYQAHNCPPSCFFLAESHLCTIHRDEGYDAKPETCRLFPFNDFRLLEDCLVVRPHSMLCPLQIHSCGESSAMSDHEGLFAAMTVKGIAATISRCTVSGDRAASVLARERQLTTISETHLCEGNYLSFAAAQLAYVAGGPGKGIDWHEDVRRFTQTICRLLAADLPPLGTSAVARTLIAMTPYLRSHFILNELASDTPNRTLAISEVPYALVTLYIIAECAQSVGMTQVTFQTVTRLLKDFLPLLVLFASLDQFLVWRHRAPVPVPLWQDPDLRSRYVSIAKALLPTSQRSTPTRLRDLLQLNCPPNDVARLLFLKELARTLDGRLAPAGDSTVWEGKRRVRTTVGAAVHRFALAHLSTEVLGAAYSRASRRPARSRTTPDA